MKISYIYKSRFIKLVLILVLLISCCSCKDNIRRFKHEAGRFIDERSGTVYVAAPYGYEATYKTDEYAKNSAGTVTFSTIAKSDPQMWLAGDDYTLYYAEGVTLPTLDTLNCTNIYVCVSTEKTTVCYIDITDNSVIENVIKAYSAGRTATLPDEPTREAYDLRFYSNDYPMLYMTYSLKIYEGGYYIGDKETEAFVNIGDCLKDYFE